MKCAGAKVAFFFLLNKNYFVINYLLRMHLIFRRSVIL